MDLNQGSIFLIPRRLTDLETSRLIDVWKKHSSGDDVFFCSSGTGASGIKSYQFSKSLLIEKSEMINNRYNITSSDIILESLPGEHIGGFTSFLRAQVLNAKFVEYKKKWSPQNFYVALKETNTTVCSLVPTQVHDLIHLQYEAPSSLKVVFVGGDFISPNLLKDARKLKWPIVLCYGMSETGAQFAGDFASNIKDSLLPLYDGYTLNENKLVSKFLYQKEFLLTEDNVVITENVDNTQELPDLFESQDDKSIRPLGRKGNDFKYKGKLFNLDSVKQDICPALEKYNLLYESKLVLKNDIRLGSIVGIHITSDIDESEFLSQINLCLKDIEISFCEKVSSLEKTDLGKIK